MRSTNGKLEVKEEFKVPEMWDMIKDTSSHYTGYYDLNTLRYQLEEFAKAVMEEYAQ